MLYILTPIFCVALCVGTVFSFLKFDNKVTASAAEAGIQFETKDVEPTGCASFVYDEHKVLYMSTSDNSDDYGSNFYDNKMVESNSAITYSGAFVSIYGNANSGYAAAPNKHRATTVLFHAAITVPAGATYKVTYSTSGSITKNKVDGMGFAAIIGYLGEDNSQLHSCAYNIQAMPQISEYIASDQKGSGTSSISLAETTKEVTYTNTDSKEKEFKSYFIFSSSTRSNNTAGVSTSASFNIQVKKVTEEYINAPENLSTTYDGNNHWINSFSDAWIKNYHSDENAVTLNSINYVPPIGSTTGQAESLGTDTSNIKKAGTYTVNMGLAKDLNRRWSDGNTADKIFTITIGQLPSVVTVTNPYSAPTYLPNELPTLTNTASNGTAGTFSWKAQQPQEGAHEYTWYFTPDDDVNYAPKEGTLTFDYMEDSILSIEVTKFNENNKTIFTNTPLTTLKSYFEVAATYASMGSDDEPRPLTSFIVQIDDNNGKLVEGSNNVTIFTNDYAQSTSYTIENVQELEYTQIVTLNFSQTTFTYPVTAEQIKDKISLFKVKRNDGQTVDGDKSETTVEGDLTVGSKTLTLKLGDLSKTFNVTINQGTLNPTVTFEDLTVTYDGSDKKIEATVSGLPEGFTLTPSYIVTGQGTATEFTNAGTYNYTVSFTHDNPNYEQYTATKTATLEIEKADYPNAGDIKFEGATVTHDGNSHKLEATDVPTGVTVTYVYDGTEQSTPFEFTEIKESGYNVTAKFAHTNPNYKDIAEKTATLYISAKPVYNITATFENDEVEYDGNSHTLVIDGDLPDGVTVKYYVGEEEFTGATIVGDYEITAKFTGSDAYAPIPDKTATLKITKADYDMSGVTFEDLTVTYDEAKHSIYVGGVELPDWITVVYTGNEVAEVGTHTVVAKFNHDNGNYNAIGDMTATLTINDAVITEIKAELSEKNYTTANGLDDLKAKLTVTAIYSNGTEAEIEDYELDFTGLRDNGKFKYGNQSLTVKYGEFTAVENNITVSREKVSLPTFKGGLKFTGVEVKPKAADFNGYDEALMTFVVDKTVSGLAVGSYKAVFALNDSENYEWATATTLKKTVFAVALYDEEITLNANEAAVDWNISKAVLTATKTDGALPIFASESYIGAFADVVTLKYYKDEACTEEVAAEDLARETQYYVKAELLDTENFELDTSAAQYTVKSFTYTTPAKELTLWDKIVRFLKTNWLWLVIAVVALLFLIILICIIASAKKKKRKKEELEEQRRLEKEEREREERKLEREERMARLNQQQAMPQMMMPQMMPQMMGQMPQMQAPQSQTAAQPAAGGGMVTEAQFMQVQAELAALKAAQENAKEVAELRAEAIRSEAALRAEAALRNDINALRAGSGQDITGGMTAATLVEIVTAAMEKVLDSREKGTAQSATATPEAAPAATQVPPDAVMTTVTTTKIDTTKKTAPTAQTAAPVRTVVRNVVAPMPVDDGRVFDVGGFYKPADPVTDMDFGDEADKN